MITKIQKSLSAKKKKKKKKKRTEDNLTQLSNAQIL